MKIKFDRKSFTVNARYDATAIDEYSVAAGKLRVTVVSGYAVDLRVNWDKKELFRTKPDSKIANWALRQMWKVQEREEQRYANEWLKATDGEWDHDPMDDYVGNYR